MKKLTQGDQETIQSGLQKLEDACNQIITQYYLDDDKTEMVKMANTILQNVRSLIPIFSGNSDLYVVSINEKSKICDSLKGMIDTSQAIFDFLNTSQNV